MKYAVGIDLGSTTTKTVVLGEDGNLLGSGITNSRSNYDIACAISLSEALVNSRIAILRSKLVATGIVGDRITSVMTGFVSGFRKQQYLEQLALLETELQRIMNQRRVGQGVIAGVASIIEAMRDETSNLYATGSNRKSDFFRDLSGSRYAKHAEVIAKERKLCFEPIMGYFDKAILVVENTALARDAFDTYARSAHDMSANGDKGIGVALREAVDVELEQVAAVGTGYGRQRLPFPKAEIRSEILCHGLGAHTMFPATRTVLDIGGQDTKAIQVDERGIVTSFQMNDRCAAGCGRYLGYIADEMNLGLHELGPLALQAKRPVRINSTCTVFAGAELRERLSLGERREDILAGLHRAIILRAMSLLARSGGVKDEFTFTGGVAKNPSAVDSLETLILENYGEVKLNISPDSIYTGALGASIFALRAWRR